ncbi:MAG: PQQ-binding-like beta-propeller repeat protein [Planctomycetaceae bacterium]
MKRIVACLLLVLSSWPAAAGDWPAAAGDWPAWRGPLGTGIADETGVPVEWSATKSVKWKTPLPGPGNSTPIVWKDAVYLTQASQDGRERSLISFTCESGEAIWKKTIVYDQKEQTHQTNPHCSPSPVTDGNVIVAWHGSAGLFAYDLDGNELWRKDLGKFEHIWGYGSSPVIYENLVILNAGPGLRAFVAAFNKSTGEEVWRREFPEAVSEKVDQFRGSWSTPVLYQEGDRTLMLLALPQRLHAVDPATGETVWHCDGLGELVYASPLVGDGVIVAMSGFHGPSFVVRTGGRGDVTATHRLWHHEGNKLNPQRVGSGAIVGDHLYILQDSGVAWCMDVATGKVVWEKRLGKSWSSMCHVDGRLYVIDMEGTTFVLEPTPEGCEVLAENRLDETTRASLAVSNGNVFVRTHENLYCIDDQ